MAHIVGTNGNDSLVGTSGVDTIEGLGGNDTLVGNAGADSLLGGTGNDLYVVGSGDILSDSGGIDTVQSTISWTLGGAFENLTFTGTGTTSGTGNELNNVITGNSGSNWLRGRGGNDTLFGGGGNDTFNMSLGAGGLYGNDSMDGGTGVDTLDFGAAALTAVVIDLGAGTASGGGSGGAGSVTLVNIENANGSAFDDRMIGSAAANFLFGYNGSDIIDGREGNDRLEGGAGNDQYVFSAAPSTANADTIVGFTSGGDKIVLDGSVHADLGANGNFAAGDARFASGAGLTSGQDANDRVIYNTTTGQLFYDADGSGAGAAQLIATLQGAPVLAATDLVAQGSGPTPIVGTEGSDSLDGTEGNDTIDGRGGNDTLYGDDGNDVLLGGAGNDSLNGGLGGDWVEGGDGNDTLSGGGDVDGLRDTLVGGLGDDTYLIYDAGFSMQPPEEMISDASGVDTVITSIWWTLGDGIENLTLLGEHEDTGSTSGTGNALDNRIVSTNADWNYYWLDGADGDDTLVGANDVRSNTYVFEAGSGNYGNDVVDGGSGHDVISFEGDGWSAISIDMRSGLLTGGGIGGAGSVAFNEVEDALGTSFGDRMVAHDGAGYYTYQGEFIFRGAELVGFDGNDTLIGGAEADRLHGEQGDDSVTGGAGNDWLTGYWGSDWLDGGTGNDTLAGFSEADRYVFSAPAGQAHADVIEAFVSGEDRIVLDRAAFGNVGDAGDFSTADARFAAGAGFTSGRDESDRIIYDTSTGNLYYDADGSGPGASLIFATASFAPGIAATDFTVIGTPAPGPAPIRGTSGNDLLVGTSAADVIEGLAGNDTLQGLGGDDGLLGGDGADRLDGGAGVDTLEGGFGDDVYVASGDGDELWDAGGVDTVIAQRTDWTLATGFENLRLEPALPPGTAELDAVALGNELGNHITGVQDARARNFFDGAAGDDTLIGGEGDDRFAFNGDSVNYGADVADGRGGEDWLDFSGSTAVTIDFRSGAATGGGPAGSGSVSFSGMERAVGTRWNDLLIANDASPQLFGGAGADTILGASGNDYLWGDKTSDNVESGPVGNDEIHGGAGNDTISGDSGSNRLFGDSGDDLLLIGGFFNVGSDTVDGGEGSDWASFGASRLIVDLQAGTATSSGGGGTATLISIENFTGSFSQDRLAGSSAANTLRGEGGNDTLIGGAGNDVLDGWAGFDEIRGQDGDDTLFGGSDIDTFQQADFAGSSPGNDFIDGGADPDWLRYDGGAAQSGVVVDLPNGAALGGGALGAGRATLRDIEAVVGTDFGDRLIGDGSENSLYGMGGDDTLTGGGGVDRLEGGAGADSYVFTGAPGTANMDAFWEFESGVDKIRLDATNMPALGASGNLTAADPRFYAAAGADTGHDADDRLVFNTATGNLWYDADGSGPGAAQLIASVVTWTGTSADPSTLDATDIVIDNGTTQPPPPPPSGGQTINGTSGNDTLNGGTGNDTLIGNAGADTLFGRDGNDRLEGGTGQDRLNGNAGADSFVFNVAPGSTNFDYVNDFVSGTDDVLLDDAAFASIGAAGTFSAGDERFVAAPGARAGLEADDRIMYDTSTGKLYYDPDGSGAAGQQVIAVITGASTLAATDIVVI